MYAFGHGVLRLVLNQKLELCLTVFKVLEGTLHATEGEKLSSVPHGCKYCDFHLELASKIYWYNKGTNGKRFARHFFVGFDTSPMKWI